MASELSIKPVLAVSTEKVPVAQLNKGSSNFRFD